MCGIDEQEYYDQGYDRGLVDGEKANDVFSVRLC